MKSSATLTDGGTFSCASAARVALTAATQPRLLSFGTGNEKRAIKMDVEIDYTNHRGERSKRFIRPVKLTWGLSEWHPGNQWILLAFCYEKQSHREFAMSSIHSWAPAKIIAGAIPEVEALKTSKPT